MSKAKSSKLDQYAATLQEMEADKKTLAEMVTWLSGEGCTASRSTISDYLAQLRSERQQAAILAQVATGARQHADLKKAFVENPAPALETIMSLHRVMTLQLATQGAENPELIKLADTLVRTVLEYTSGKTKAEIKERELRLAEDRFQVTVCEKFLAWFKESKAREIAESTAGNAEKIAALRREYFKDVDALQKSGTVTLPE